jgi:hypothetical protein
MTGFETAQAGGYDRTLATTINAELAEPAEKRGVRL